MIPQSVVPAFLGNARWFGGKGRDFSVTRTRRLGTLGTERPAVVVDLVEVTYDQGETETYQLPLACYPESQDRLGHAFIAEWDDPDLGHVFGYDAIHDRDAMALFLEGFDHDASGDLALHRMPGHHLDLTSHSSAFSGEQSNSSVMFGEDAVLKFYRKVMPGENPDITIHEALTRAGCDDIAQLYGWVAAGDLQLGMLQQFLRTAADGWDLALASVRNLFAEADLHADEVGGDFFGEAERLGAALSEVHAALVAEFGTDSLNVDSLVKEMHERFGAAVAIVPELAEHRPAVTATYDALNGLTQVRTQRIHGDLHLGQTLRTSLGWKIVDFEGEPAKPLAERVRPDSRLRDVAGMLRSFDYAPHAVARTSGEVAPDAAHQREFRSREWTRRNAQAFLAGYTGGAGLSIEEQDLLAAYECDKAIYECVYEARNRPTWLSIPLAAIEGLSQ